MTDETPNKQQPPAEEQPGGPTADPFAVPGYTPEQAQEATHTEVSAFGERYAREEHAPDTRPTDELIECVAAAFSADPRTAHVADQVVIRVLKDVVQLHGTVGTPETAAALIEVAQSVQGVGEVQSELQS
jgi:osmotically-inducible protein OsmY